MKLLYISEITGKAGIAVVKKILPSLKKKYLPDVIIGNANSATASGGLGRQHAAYLRKLGLECITAGDLIFNKHDLVEVLDKTTYVLRPANLPDYSPGNGWKLLYVNNNPEKKIAVISVLGRVGQRRISADNPFVKLENLISFFKNKTNIIIIDFSSNATAEKQSLAYYLDGKVSAIIGSGTKVQTSDERIFDGGTAYITDAGRTGSFNSVGGYVPEHKIREYLRCLPDFGRDCWDKPVFQGVCAEIGEDGKALRIERIFEEVPLCKNGDL